MIKNSSRKKRELRRPEYHSEPVLHAWKDCRKLERLDSVRLENETIEDCTADTFSECELKHVVFRGRYRGILFADAVFEHCDFSNAELDESQFRRCIFRNCRMMGTTFIRSTLEDVILDRCVATYANFNRSSWKVAEWNDSIFEEAGFGGCTFQEIKLKECNFTGCDFLETKLAGMDFSDSILQRIKIRPEDLKGATFSYEQAVLCAALLGVTIR